MKKTLSGFGNHFESEAIAGALPQGQNSPQKPPLGLYAEQLSGSAFTAPRGSNLRSWLYRIRPSVTHGEFQPYEKKTLHWLSGPLSAHLTPPTPLRWSPPPFDQDSDFIDSIVTYTVAGESHLGRGLGVLMYRATKSMGDRYFYNSDGELMILPETGAIEIRTEFGVLHASAGDMIVIPRGIKFQVNIKDKKSRGYVCENYGSPFRLPDLGPIGANGLANPRDFLAPAAAFDKKPNPCELIVKHGGSFWRTELTHSPLDVVAWHGNYTPYHYDLRRFNTMGSVSYDHPDPSIYTVLTSPSEIPGTANCDFVIFPDRWLVQENTFRPPYYHRNTMSEFMGLLYGVYDAKEEGFLPGGATLHNCMSGHGPESEVMEKATQSDLKPQHLTQTMAFMWETRYPYAVSEWALSADHRDKNYVKCWSSLKSNFNSKM